MNTIITPEIREITEEAVYFHPAISIIMPFEPKMSSKRELTHLQDLAIDKVECELLENYPDELVILMMQKLKTRPWVKCFRNFPQSVLRYPTVLPQLLLRLKNSFHITHCIHSFLI
jgi:hypothetical protein